MSHFTGQLKRRFRFQVKDLLSVSRGVFDLGARAFADIAADIDDIYGVCHIYFTLVHVVQL